MSRLEPSFSCQKCLNAQTTPGGRHGFAAWFFSPLPLGFQLYSSSSKR
jgi:hypothetical protein